MDLSFVDEIINLLFELIKRWPVYAPRTVMKGVELFFVHVANSNPQLPQELNFAFPGQGESILEDAVGDFLSWLEENLSFLVLDFLRWLHGASE